MVARGRETILLVLTAVLVIKSCSSTVGGDDCKTDTEYNNESGSLPLLVNIKPIADEWTYSLRFTHRSSNKDFSLVLTSEGLQFDSELSKGRFDDDPLSMMWTKDLFPLGEWTYFTLHEDDGKLYISHSRESNSTDCHHDIGNSKDTLFKIEMLVTGSDLSVNCHGGCNVFSVSGEFTPNPDKEYYLQAMNPPKAMCRNGLDVCQVEDRQWHHYQESSGILDINGNFLISENCDPEAENRPTSDTTITTTILPTTTSTASTTTTTTASTTTTTTTSTTTATDTTSPTATTAVPTPSTIETNYYLPTDGADGESSTPCPITSLVSERSDHPEMTPSDPELKLSEETSVTTTEESMITKLLPAKKIGEKNGNRNSAMVAVTIITILSIVCVLVGYVLYKRKKSRTEQITIGNPEQITINNLKIVQSA